LAGSSACAERFGDLQPSVPTIAQVLNHSQLGEVSGSSSFLDEGEPNGVEVRGQDPVQVATFRLHLHPTEVLADVMAEPCRARHSQ
jgi:hypothetical protein